MKRNKPTCDRLGNVYDACQWMLKFKINNNTTNDLTSFCSVIKINKRKYKLCGNKAKKKLGWAPKISFEELVKEMIDEDLKLAKNYKKI